MYDTTCSSPLPTRPPFESSDEISLFLHHLLHSSSSSSTLISDQNKLLNQNLPSSIQHQQQQQQQSTLFSSSNPQFKSLLLDDHNCPSQSTRVLDSDNINNNNRLTSASTTDESLELKESGIVSNVVGRSADCEPVIVSTKRRKQLVENYLDDFDCESEEGLEGSEGPTKSAPSRNSSKRSRAAEVHNLSEKRRRSRINEKMKALQNLIPNSNKTDKASMLDEAIEYLKQLQLQVQMLSMRNGFSLHPMYLPGVLQPLQVPQIRMGFDEGDGLPPHMGIGRDRLPVNSEPSTQTSFGLSNHCTTSNQPVVMPSLTNITPSETSYGLDPTLQSHQGSFQMSATSEDIYREQMLRQQQFYVNRSSHNPSGDNKMKSIATGSLPFDAQASGLEHANCVEASILHGEGSESMLPKDVENNQTFMQHFHSLQTGLSLPKDNPAR